MNPDKRINYCFVDRNGTPRIVVVIKWEKGNLYFMDIDQPWKKSYHSPRNGKSQVHIKVDGFMPMAPAFSNPIEEIKGCRMMGGSGMELHRLESLPAPKDGAENYILDTRPFLISNLSKVQWSHYLVEPGNETELDEILERHRKNQAESGMSEQVAVHKITSSTPWLVTEFTRICDENPRWYEGLGDKS